MQWIEQNLVWFAVAALVLLAMVSTFRWELPLLTWRELLMKLGAPRGSTEIAPPPEHVHHHHGSRSHEAMPHKPAFHRSGRRSIQ